MRVRCRGSVLRIDSADDRRGNSVQRDFDGENKVEGWPVTGTASQLGEKSEPTKIGVAVCLNGYEYLSEEDNGPAEFRRISALHANAQVSTPASPADANPRSPQRPL
jgi:hypothetical protein